MELLNRVKISGEEMVELIEALLLRKGFKPTEPIHLDSLIVEVESVPKDLKKIREIIRLTPEEQKERFSTYSRKHYKNKKILEQTS